MTNHLARRAQQRVVVGNELAITMRYSSSLPSPILSTKEGGRS
jgi:hypothetical protein